MDSRIKKGIAGFATAATLAIGGAATDAQLNPYESKADLYEIRAESVLPDAGENKVEIEKDRPAVRLSKWNGEAAMTIAYDKVQGNASRPLFTDRIEWKGEGSEEVHAYPLEAKEGMEDGGFEIEIILNDRPAEALWEFDIEGSSELTFDYQGTLAEENPDLDCDDTVCRDENGEEIIWRPENVVGSYVVSDFSKVNVEGGINYGNNKLFHIFRPKAIDANGDEVWCKLSYNMPSLSVDCRDQAKWFETAALPITIDPTLGYTTIGGTQTNDGGKTQYAYVSASEGGTLTTLTIYCQVAQAFNLTVASAWYTDSAGDPSTKTYTTTAMAECVSSTPGWRSGTLSGSFTTGDYWIGFHQGSGVIRYYYDATGTSDADTTFTSIPATATPANTPTNRNWSVYVTYTADAPPSAPVVEDVWFFE